MQEGYAAPESAILAEDCESAITAFQSFVEWLFSAHEIKWLDECSAYIPHEGSTYELLADEEISANDAEVLIKHMDLHYKQKGYGGW